MQLKLQKRIAASVMKCSPKRIKMSTDSLSEIKESITKKDIRDQLSDGTIRVLQKRGTSRVRARKRKEQKVKGKRKGHGSRKGKKTARLPKKEVWMTKIRKQRKLIKEFRDKNIISTSSYRILYQKSKGGFFRSVRHIKLYINEHNLITKKQEK